MTSILYLQICVLNEERMCASSIVSSEMVQGYVSHQTIHLARCRKTGQGGGEEDGEEEYYWKLIVSYLLLLFLF